MLSEIMARSVLCSYQSPEHQHHIGDRGRQVQGQCQNVDCKLRNSSFCACIVQIWSKNTNRCSRTGEYPLQSCWTCSLVHYRLWQNFSFGLRDM